MTSQVLNEMKTVLTGIKTGGFLASQNSMTVQLTNGRKYEVCLAMQTHSGEWVATADRILGYYRCSRCPPENSPGIPGGNWLQITLKNGSPSEPVVRLHEICMHYLTNHPDALAEWAYADRCIQVFGYEESTKTQNALFELAETVKKAEEFADASSVNKNDLLDYITNVLLTTKFQDDPKSYINEWATKRDVEDQALIFFKKQL